MSRQIAHPGPEPVGDPQAMRHKAAELKGDGDRLRDTFATLPALGRSVEFEADVAKRWRHELRALERHAHTYAGQADELARTLVREARALEDRQQAWRRKFDEWIYQSHPEYRPPEHPPGHPDQGYA